MPAEVLPCKEILVPQAGRKVVEGIIADKAVPGFADEIPGAFPSRLFARLR
jgi:hypothetical protein